MTIETLTDEERAYLRKAMSHPSVLKALRCIDQRDAEVARLKEELDQARRELLGWSKDVARLTSERDEARASDLQTGEVLAQTHAAHVKAETEVARLTEALAAAEKSRLEWRADVIEWSARAKAAEQKLAAAERGTEEPDAAGLYHTRVHRDGPHVIVHKQFSKQLIERAKAAEQALAAAEKARIEERGRWEQKLNVAESELTQLRERVRELEEFAAPLYNGESEARIALESELTQLRERVAKALTVLESGLESRNYRAFAVRVLEALRNGQ